MVLLRIGPAARSGTCSFRFSLIVLIGSIELGLERDSRVAVGKG